MLKQTLLIFDAVEKLTLESDAHYHLYVPTLFSFEGFANDRVNFIFDTGAFLTVLARETAALFGFIEQFTTQSNVPLSGFAGECLADIKEIPGFIIGGRKIEGVKVAVPHIDTGINILGLNIIEYFKYYVDTETDEIYFAENKTPVIPKELQAKKIYVVSRPYEDCQ